MKCARYFVVCLLDQIAGADPGFQVSGGRTLKNCAERREARTFLGYFVWKITMLCQKIIYLPIAEEGTKSYGVFRVKNHDFTPKKNHIFSNFRGGAHRVRPLPWIRLWIGTKIFNFVVFRSTISKTPFWRERERMMPHASFVVGYIYIASWRNLTIYWTFLLKYKSCFENINNNTMNHCRFAHQITRWSKSVY